MTSTLSDHDIQTLADAIAARIRYLVVREELDVLSVEQVAAQLGRGERWVLNEIRGRKMRAAKVGGAWVIKAADLNTYVEDRMNLARIRRRRF